jgi:hypothetical protein
MMPRAAPLWPGELRHSTDIEAVSERLAEFNLKNGRIRLHLDGLPICFGEDHFTARGGVSFDRSSNLSLTNLKSLRLRPVRK